ncbi:MULTISPECIES: 4-carboxy-4-hydroxy-2-oxoadipate aldolase/oxaloacetate decarboxylase [Haloferax]|jgi:4-hydroxy-4-methyl-2-oxoglutarate aldolase|uniref:4-carboxy-4-hydroxy-2-oxoadipate aldolase/oxaloacetate decarboxylase n=10 Tax=Haloferax TaxID=2251 RepID=A0A6C0UTK3_HALVO|nr:MULTISPECIES: 4-carboxy-4-hydroxy-2-oxoadipate aldolase/oxaloacetate decarboxylase [Haloferax]ELK55771.1 demethylmenaquinone methyltransferase [Haloferax sp. BAB-2207]ELZ58442.1 demethylmenaquinone methyltransferase [Haloferax sp. ATCC BAA-646]ELZ63126.1 demethylmenaquinone methyltransferase [Haloferax sp. ATCC BAA-644]ELZ63246.1 demethylmenaquinone methyltransferase [Haloferax sp. ATCC BAA-645]ELZ71051.1 demethylmenaquinone methyltransferase [Haloferax lucentense DSM 14919]
MHTIEPDVERPDRELVEAFEEIPSTIVSDVTGNIGLTMDAGLRPAYDGVEMAGTAVTVKAAPGDNLIIHKAITLTEPGDVLIIDCDGYTDTGHVGELMCTSCQANGLAGLVIDGAYRDSREIAEMEFPVYGRGVNPQGPLKQDPGSINVTVSVGGVSVDPGDIVIGDDDGLAVIPREGAEEVLERAHEKLSAEDSVREEVLEGEYLYELNGYDELFENLTIVGPEDSIQ